MRQGDGSDLLGPNDPRSADIGILYVGPDDSRQEILTTINTQELRGRKQIAIVLPDHGKAFRQPVDFDGLKNMRRGLKATLIFIASPGPGPAEFARQRRFAVYSSLESFKTELVEGGPHNPRARMVAGPDKRPKLLRGSRTNKGRDQNILPTPPTVPAVPSPVPPTPRITPIASAQPVMPPTPSTRVPSQAIGPGAQSAHQATPPIEDMETHTLELENPAPERGGGSGAALAAGAAMGALAASALDDDDGLAPPVTPRQPQGGGVVPTAQGSTPSGGQAPRPAEGRRSPTPLLLGQQTNTPRPGAGGSGKLPAASSQGTQTRSGSGKLNAVQGRAGSRPGPTRGRGTKQLDPAQGAMDAAEVAQPPNGKNSGSGKLPAAIPVGVAAAGAAGIVAASGVNAPPPGNPPANVPLPAATAVTGTPGGVVAGQRQVGLTPLPVPPRSRRARGRKRLLLFVLLALLTLLVIGGIVVAAVGGPSGLATIGQLTATVTITPRSKVVQNNYLISGVATPNANQRQVAARVISQQSDTKSATANATGSIPAKQAVGVLRFINTNATATTLASTTITGSDNVEVTFNGPITVPSNPPFIDVNAYAVNAGAAGNIKALDVNEGCCFSGITVRNTAPFHGGQDAQPNSIIQQSDINGAAQPLITQLTSSTQAAVQKDVRSNERVVDGSANCTPTTNADHKAGDHAGSVTVSVSVACSEVVYDLTGAQRLASSLLPTNLPDGTNLAGYALVGAVVTSPVSATVVTKDGRVSINMQAAGRWVYQFTAQQQQQIKAGLVKLSKADAFRSLRQVVGLASADISISSGSLMPGTANNITLDIVSIPGLTPGSASATNTPYVPIPTGGSTPTESGPQNVGS